MAKPPITPGMLDQIQDEIQEYGPQVAELRRKERERQLTNVSKMFRYGDQPMEGRGDTVSAQWERQMELYEQQQAILTEMGALEKEMLEAKQNEGMTSRRYLMAAAQVFGAMADLRGTEVSSELQAQQAQFVAQLGAVTTILANDQQKIFDQNKENGDLDTAADKAIAQMGFVTDENGQIRPPDGEAAFLAAGNQIAGALRTMTPKEKAAFERRFNLKRGGAGDLRSLLNIDAISTSLGAGDGKIGWDDVDTLNTEQSTLVSEYGEDVKKTRAAVEKHKAKFGANVSSMLGTGESLLQLVTGMDSKGNRLSDADRRKSLAQLVPGGDEESIVFEEMNRLRIALGNRDLPITTIAELEASLATNHVFQHQKEQSYPGLSNVEYIELMAKRNKQRQDAKQDDRNIEAGKRSMYEQLNDIAAGEDVRGKLTRMIAKGVTDNKGLMRKGKFSFAPKDAEGNRTPFWKQGKEEDKRPTEAPPGSDAEAVMWKDKGAAERMATSLNKETTPSKMVTGAEHASDPNKPKGK